MLYQRKNWTIDRVWGEIEKSQKVPKGAKEEIIDLALRVAEIIEDRLGLDVVCAFYKAYDNEIGSVFTPGIESVLERIGMAGEKHIYSSEGSVVAKITTYDLDEAKEIVNRISEIHYKDVYIRAHPELDISEGERETYVEISELQNVKRLMREDRKSYDYIYIDDREEIRSMTIKIREVE